MTGTAAGLLALARPRFAGLPAGFEAAAFQPVPLPRFRGPKPAGFWRRRAVRGGPGAVLALALFAAVGLYGATRNGSYSDFVKTYGAPGDLAAQALGFSIKAVTITGSRALDAREILQAAGIDPSRSLLFVNPADVRARLMAIPLVRDAVVTKLFPNRMTIAIEEREPVAIWQVNGKLSIVSGDGVVIDEVHDDRFSRLPFVVGEGANSRVAEFLKLMDSAGDLRPHIAAGMLVGERRWSLKMDNGVVVDLPEIAPGAALSAFATLDDQSHFLDKDVVSVDLRIPGRLTARLSEDAAAARAAMLAKKPKPKGTEE